MVNVYNPDSWVVLRMTHKDQIIYKVLGGWSSDYLNGSSWRLNSGIEKADLNDNVYSFYGASGSVYNCHKDSYGLRMSTAGIWDGMKNKYPDQVELLDDCDWTKFDFGNI
jgi:hypothetical protein